MARTVQRGAQSDIQAARSCNSRLRQKISFEPGKLFGAWSVRDSHSQKILGSITLSEIGPIHAQMEFLIHYDYWKSKASLEALKRVLQWTFESLPEFERIQCQTLPQNVAGKPLLLRVVMDLGGINRSSAKVNGRVVDLVSFGLTRNRYESFQSASETSTGWIYGGPLFPKQIVNAGHFGATTTAD